MGRLSSRRKLAMETLFEVDLGQPVEQMRAVPVCLGSGAPRAFLAAYCADYDVDPYVEMFFFPKDTLKMALISENGEILWRRDLGPAVVPGMWFCPVFPFDLDGDGVDEIWFVNNVDPAHPLAPSKYRLERLDVRTGETTGQWPWPNYGRVQTGSLSHAFRNFILGGLVYGQPVLVTAQGTYGSMHLQGWNPGMTERWRTDIPADAPGARGSHMCPVTDLDGDGVEEVMWGERCIELDGGRELFCADRDVYRGHSDVIQPVLDENEGRWILYTCRESDPEASPRVVAYDAKGRRLWGRVDHGHIDMGWVARIGDDYRKVGAATRIGKKLSGPDGHVHEAREEFAFDALTGDPLDLPFAAYQTLPADLDGDGYHELVRGAYRGDGVILNRHGDEVGQVNGYVALASKLLDHPGEQLLTFALDGIVRLWVNRDAADREEASKRYAHPFYRSNARLMASGSNRSVLGGL